MKQQSLKEFLEGIDEPDHNKFDYEDSHYDWLVGQHDLAQEILSMYFTERNFE